MAGISDDVENLRVNRGDFFNALEEVHPAFGVSEEELLEVIQNGIIRFDDIVNVSIHSFTIFPCSLVAAGPSPHRETFRGTSPLIYSHSFGQHYPSWSSRIRQNRLRGNDRARVAVPIH